MLLEEKNITGQHYLQNKIQFLKYALCVCVCVYIFLTEVHKEACKDICKL